MIKRTLISFLLVTATFLGTACSSNQASIEESVQQTVAAQQSVEVAVEPTQTTQASENESDTITSEDNSVLETSLPPTSTITEPESTELDSIIMGTWRSDIPISVFMDLFDSVSFYDNIVIFTKDSVERFEIPFTYKFISDNTIELSIPLFSEPDFEFTIEFDPVNANEILAVISVGEIFSIPSEEQTISLTKETSDVPYNATYPQDLYGDYWEQIDDRRRINSFTEDGYWIYLVEVDDVYYAMIKNYQLTESQAFNYGSSTSDLDRKSEFYVPSSDTLVLFVENPNLDPENTRVLHKIGDSLDVQNAIVGTWRLIREEDGGTAGIWQFNSDGNLEITSYGIEDGVEVTRPEEHYSYVFSGNRSLVIANDLGVQQESIVFVIDNNFLVYLYFDGNNQPSGIRVLVRMETSD